MAKEKFSKSDLSRVAAQVKRTILQRAKRGIYLDQRLTKYKALKQLAASLKQVSGVFKVVKGLLT